MTFRRAVVVTHRWLGVVAAAIWIVQAGTGIFCVFHWEIEDAGVRGPHRRTDWRMIERRLPAFGDVNSMWTTAGAADRYDVFTKSGTTFRIDGEGNVLRASASDGWVTKVVVLHQTLMLDRRITGTSGVFLLSNLIFGVIAAWPRMGQWKRAFLPTRAGTRVATLYGWHRALGLWLAIPAMCIVSAGILLAFDVEVEDARPRVSSGPANVSFTRAIETALAKWPRSEVSGINFPSPEDAMWTITLKQRGEHQRAYGKTRVFVSAIDGAILGVSDALHTRAAVRFSNLLFPLHTGEAFGFFGRVIVLTIGGWLLTMIYLGLALFLARR